METRKVLKLLSIVLVAVTVAGTIMYVKSLKSDFESTKLKLEQSQQQISVVQKSIIQDGHDEYKKLKVLCTFAEVPKTWNIYANSEYFGVDKFLPMPTAAISPRAIVFGMGDWTQTNLFFAGNDISERLIDEAKKARGGTWSKEIIAGVEADVNTLPLENGQATMGGSGGKEYYLKLPGKLGYDPKTLVIYKNAKLDDKSEAEFKHFLDTMKFLSGTDCREAWKE